MLLVYLSLSVYLLITVGTMKNIEDVDGSRPAPVA